MFKVAVLWVCHFSKVYGASRLGNQYRERISAHSAGRTQKQSLQKLINQLKDTKVQVRYELTDVCHSCCGLLKREKRVCEGCIGEKMVCGIEEGVLGVCEGVKLYNSEVPHTHFVCAFSAAAEMFQCLNERQVFHAVFLLY